MDRGAWWATVHGVTRVAWLSDSTTTTSQSYGFSSSHIWMWELDHKESWVLKNWCFRTVLLEKTLESPLDWRWIKLVNPEGNQPWIYFGRIGAEAEGPILWPSDVNNWLLPKDPDAGKDWMWEEKETTADDGCMASSTQQTWVWVSSRSWWWTGRPGMLQSMGSQRVGHNWMIELNWTDSYHLKLLHYFKKFVVFIVHQRILKLHIQSTQQ